MTDRTLRRCVPILLAALANVAYGETSVADRVTSLERRVATVEKVTGVVGDAITLEGGPAPLVVHIDAADAIDVTRLGDTRVAWDFGDPEGERNALDGFNAAHAFDKPGRYTITRTVDVTGATPTHAVQTYVVDVGANARRTIYVSADGDDRNDGATPERPIRTWAAATAAVRGGTQVLFRRGDTFAVARGLDVRADDVRLASYGDAALPVPTLQTTAYPLPGGFSILAMHGRRMVVEDVAFDSTGGKPFDKPGLPDGIAAGGRGLLVRRCVFRNVISAIAGGSDAAGVFVIDCDAPLDTGVRGYFTWIQGANWTVLDNHAANSTREHILRVGGAERINVQGNHFTNLDRRKLATNPDPTDMNKSTINVQRGRVLYVAHNVFVDGPVSVGPLGGGDGLTSKDARWIGAVVEDNRCINAQLQVQHGASHVTYRNMLVRRDNDAAIWISGFNNDYQRGVDDLTIEHVTAVDAGAIGQFVRLWGSATGVRLIDNYYAAPNLLAGAYDTAAVYVTGSDLSSFAEIRGNRWPAMRATAGANNGVNYVALKDATTAGYINAARWATMTPVSGDAIVPVTSIDVLRSEDAGVDVSCLPPDPSAMPTTMAATPEAK